MMENLSITKSKALKLPNCKERKKERKGKHV